VGEAAFRGQIISYSKRAAAICNGSDFFSPLSKQARRNRGKNEKLIQK